MKQVTAYESFDGRTFATAAECRQHEKDQAPARLVGLTAEQVAAAMDRRDADLAEAFETVGARIAAARREAGDLKRRRAPAETSGSETGDAREPPQSEATDAEPKPQSEAPATDGIPAIFRRGEAA
jgi:hypothetical protein